ncbi:MAG: hypothetical protein MJ176_05045 [Treponema sp.]|nr:hypothetical protein [Treponema sp.]
MKINKTLSILAAAIILFAGCTEKKPEITADSIPLEIKASSEKLEDYTQIWHATNKKVAVILGYGVNSDEISESIISALSQRYGLEKDAGLIMPLVYPKDFRHGVKGYSSDLEAFLNSEEIDFAGLVIVGAPENTHKALAKNQDSWTMRLPYPVISIYPQDDVLGMESCCDLVFDKAGLEKEDDITEEDTATFSPEEIIPLLKNAIDYMGALEGPVEKDQLEHAKNMFPDHNIRRYADPESGLLAINHFVLK